MENTVKGHNKTFKLNKNLIKFSTKLFPSIFFVFFYNFACIFSKVFIISILKYVNLKM